MSEKTENICLDISAAIAAGLLLWGIYEWLGFAGFLVATGLGGCGVVFLRAYALIEKRKAASGE